MSQPMCSMTRLHAGRDGLCFERGEARRSSSYMDQEVFEFCEDARSDMGKEETIPCND